MDDSSSYRRPRRRRSRRRESADPYFGGTVEDLTEEPERPRQTKRSTRKGSARTKESRNKEGRSKESRNKENTKARTEKAEDNVSRGWLAVRIAVTAICAIAGYFVFKATFVDNATPTTITVMAPLIPVFFVIYLLYTLDFRPTAFFIGLYVQIFAFLFLVHLRQRDFDDFSFDWAIYAQMTILLVGAAYVIWNARRLLTAWPWQDFISILLVVFIVLSALSLIGSPNPGYGASSIGVLLNLLGITAVLVLCLRPGELQTVLAIALLPPVVLSLVTHFTQTEMNMVWGMSTDYSVPRLRGVSGTPVGMSQQCAFLGMLAIARMATAQRRRAGWFVFGLIVIPLGAYVSWLSESRSPPMAFLIAVFVAMVLYYKPFGRMSLLISIVGCMVVLPIGYFVLEQGVSQSVLAGLSRTGQAAEISTLTGRVEIWTVVFELVSQRPFLGHGLGSGVITIREAFEGTDLDIVHSHNLPLHMAYSVGVGGAVVISLLIFAIFIRAYRSEDLMVLIVISFLFLSNITETSILTNRPSFVTFLFLLMACRLLSLRSKEKPARRKADNEQKPSGRRRRSNSENREGALAS